MASINWAQAVSGTWTTAADWAGGVVPGPDDTALIEAVNGRAKYTVSIATPVAVGGLVLDAKNATLSVDSTLTVPNMALESGTLLLDNGTLAGTVAESGGVLKLGGTNDTLENVTYQGSLTYTGGKSTLTISGGLTLTGAGDTGPGYAFLGSHVVLDDVSTLNNATLRGGTINVENTPTLTLGSGLTLEYASLKFGSGSALLVNDGLLTDVAVTGGTFTNNGTITSNSNIAAAAFTNNGLIDIAGTFLLLDVKGLNAAGAAGAIDVGDNGALVFVGSETTAQLNTNFTQQHVTTSGSLAGIGISGTLDNSGATLDVGTGTRFGMFSTYYSQVGGDGVISGGTVVDEGGFGAISGTLSGLTLQSTTATLNLAASVNTELDNVTVTGATTVMGDGVGFNGGTLSGVGTLSLSGSLNGVDITGAGGSGAVTILTTGLTITAAQSVVGYDIQVTSGGLTLSPGATLDSAQVTFADPGATESFLYENSPASSGVTLGASLVTTITSGTNVTFDSDYGNVDPLVAFMGTFDIAGTLQLGTESYIGIDNTGTIALSSGGSLYVSAYSSPYTTVMNEGTVTSNAGVIDIATGIANSGLISDSFGGAATTETIGGAVTGAGTLAITGAGTLALGGTVAAGQIVKLGAGKETLALTSAAASTGFSGTVDGFAKGDTVVLAGETVSAAGFSGASIVATLSAGGTIAIATGKALHGALSVTENSGNATLTYVSTDLSLGDWPAAATAAPASGPAAHEVYGTLPRFDVGVLDMMMAHHPWH